MAPQEDDGHSNVNNVLMPEDIKKTEAHLGEAAGGAAAIGAGAAAIQSLYPQGADRDLAISQDETVAALAKSIPDHPEAKHVASSAAHETTTAQLAGTEAMVGAYPSSVTQDLGASQDQTEAALAKAIPPETKMDPTMSSAASEPTSAQSAGVAAMRDTHPSSAEKDLGTSQDETIKALTSSLPRESDHPTISSAVPDSSTSQLAGQVPLERVYPGAFPETPAAVEPQLSVNPIPATTTIGNPISLPAGEKPPHPSQIPVSYYSSVTTSKEDYERDASAGVPTGVAAMAGSAFSVPENPPNMIPESSLPMGGAPVDTNDTGPIIQSAAPESSTAGLAGGVPLEPKRQAFVVDDRISSGTSGPSIQSAAPKSSTAALAGGVPLEAKREGFIEDEAPSATLSGPAPGVPEMVQESMSKAHEDPEAAADAEAVSEKKAVETELLRTVQSTDATGEPAPSSAAALSETAPAATGEIVATPAKEATGVAATNPAGGSAPSAATEKKTEIPATQPDSTAVSATNASTAVAEKKDESPTSDKKVSSAQDVSPMSRDTNVAAATSSPPVKPSNAAAPQKSTTASATSSPSNNEAAKEKKKKNRASGFFGRLKERFK